MLQRNQQLTSAPDIRGAVLVHRVCRDSATTDFARPKVFRRFHSPTEGPDTRRLRSAQDTRNEESKRREDRISHEHTSGKPGADSPPVRYRASAAQRDYLKTHPRTPAE